MRPDVHGSVVLSTRIGGLLVASPTWAEFDPDAYREFLEEVRDQTTEELVDAHAPYGPFPFSVSGDPLSAEFLEAIVNCFELTDGELALLDRNGFMVSERLTCNSYGAAFDAIWHADLPVFVSTDAILHAIHRSYVAVLEAVELRGLDDDPVPRLEPRR